jgi:hypothetical protein
MDGMHLKKRRKKRKTIGNGNGECCKCNVCEDDVRYVRSYYMKKRKRSKKKGKEDYIGGKKLNDRKRDRQTKRERERKKEKERKKERKPIGLSSFLLMNRRVQTETGKKKKK